MERNTTKRTKSELLTAGAAEPSSNLHDVDDDRSRSAQAQRSSDDVDEARELQLDDDDDDYLGDAAEGRDVHDFLCNLYRVVGLDVHEFLQRAGADATGLSSEDVLARSALPMMAPQLTVVAGRKRAYVGGAVSVEVKHAIARAWVAFGTVEDDGDMEAFLKKLRECGWCLCFSSHRELANRTSMLVRPTQGRASDSAHFTRQVCVPQCPFDQRR